MLEHCMSWNTTTAYLAYQVVYNVQMKTTKITEYDHDEFGYE